MAKKLLAASVAAVAALTTVMVSSGGNAAATAPDGATVFKQTCAACHKAVAGQAAGVGPNLAGVVGRKAGATSYNYSVAMKKSGIVWTRVNLEKYLAGPAKVVPGTKMTMAVADAAKRKAVLDFLAKAK